MDALWRSVRMSVLEEQKGVCFSCPKSARDVVKAASGRLVAYCRSCRLRLDGAARARKGHHTKLVNREKASGQTSLLA